MIRQNMPILIKHIVDTENKSIEDIFTQKGRIYTFLNPVSYLTALKNKFIFGEFDGIFADGSILVIAIKLFYRKKVTRRSFDMTSLAPKLLRYAEKNKKTIYIVASQQEQIEKAVTFFKEKYPDILFTGYRNGYFSSDIEMEKEAENIAKVNPDLLIVGMGTLMQEKFLIKVKSKGYQGIGFTCGGFIHQSTKDKLEYYPIWINKLNLRFIYRMYKEKHTRKRYLQAAILFPIKFILEYFYR